ncbi:hypothetical protein GWI33_013793 [Rhynchophorus ferrugineus]|uniref:Uncharacterized protein n=1 Tax=Rhynchophorus ferrugineus TaxID=354439 RepID=A0A834I3Z2_RHYFE|nr:hypothetical protein GWI33_013793 [Rhynchophorus ferrugineus]
MCLKLNIKSNELPKSPDIVSRTSKSVSLMENSFKISPSNSKYTDVNLSEHSASGLNSLKNMGGSQQSSKHISILKSPQIEINKNNVENSEAQLSEKSYLYVPVADVKFEDLQREVNVRNKLIRTLEEDNSILKTDIQTMRVSVYCNVYSV